MTTEYGWPKGRGPLPTFVRENGLALASCALFVLSLTGHAAAGHRVANDEAREHGEQEQSLSHYLVSGDFVESVFENWESEFLQMALFVVMTKFLRQKGSSESKPLDQQSPVDEDPRRSDKPDRPWPVRRGGLALTLYERSLSLALFALFVLSFVLHAAGGARSYGEEQRRHGRATVSIVQYLGTSQFWFESFQNWQSEFLSVGCLVVLSIFLRERGSSQSKPVAESSAHTGDS